MKNNNNPPAPFLSLRILLLCALAVLLTSSCTTQFVAKRTVYYATSENATIFVFNKKERMYLMPISAEGFFPSFEYRDVVTTNVAINANTPKRTLKTPDDFSFPFSISEVRGKIVIHEELKRIDVSMATGTHSTDSQQDTYTDIRALPFMDQAVADLYLKAQTLSNNELVDLIKSNSKTSGVNDRNIILSSLITSNPPTPSSPPRISKISSKYRRQPIGLYFNEKYSKDHSLPVNMIAIYDFDQELVDKIERYSVIVYDYDYLK